MHDAEFLPVAIFLSIDRTRLFERARCSGLFCSDRARSLRAMHRLFVVQLVVGFAGDALTAMTGMKATAIDLALWNFIADRAYSKHL